MMYIIYKLTNTVNGKEYVGLTSSTIDNRWRQHIYASRHKNTKTHLVRAIRKYGKEAFTSQVLCSCRTVEDAEEMERHFIAEHDTLSNGYNMTAGGNCTTGLSGELNGMYGKTHTPDVRQKLSETASERFKGKSYAELYGEEKAEELKRKRSETFSAVDKSGERNSMYGKNHSNETKAKMSAAATEWKTGKTYEEMYGEEKAKELKRKRSEVFSQIDRSGSKNSKAKRASIKSVEFDCAKDATTHFGVSYSTIKKWLRTLDDCYYL